MATRPNCHQASGNLYAVRVEVGFTWAIPLQVLEFIPSTSRSKATDNMAERH
jgi:hypothetical protein